MRERDTEGYMRGQNAGSPTEPTGAFQNLKFGTLSVFAKLSGIACSSLVFLITILKAGG